MPPASELRLLVLGNSGDLVDLGPQLGTRLLRLQQAVAEIIQRPVRAEFAAGHPAPGLSRHVGRVLEETDPDVVVLHCNYYGVAAASLRVYLETAFSGHIAPLVRRWVPVIRRLLNGAPAAGEAAEELRVRRASYYAVRNALLRAGLRRTLTSVDAAAEAYDEAIALIASHEGITTVVRGSIPQLLPHYPARLNREGMERIIELDRRIAGICARHRVPFCSPVERMNGDLTRYLQPDGLHANAEGQALTLELELELLRGLLG